MGAPGGGLRGTVREGATVAAIVVRHGRRDPLILEPGLGASAVELAGPEGVESAAAEAMVAVAISAPVDGPPLPAFAVPGDRVAVALAGPLPQPEPVVAALAAALGSSGVERADVSVLVGAPSGRLPAGATPFDGHRAGETSYLAADEAGHPLHLSRTLVDADLVVEVGAHRYDPALGAVDPQGALWPAFGRSDCVVACARAVALRGRRALPGWRSTVERMRWELGVGAVLRLVPGRHGTLHAACFGTPAAAARAARSHAVGWRPRVTSPARLAVATLSETSAPETLVRAVAAASRVTRPDATICLVGTIPPPGPVFTRWRDGVAVRALVEEAVASGNAEWIADAARTRLCARALGARRVVLLCDLDDALVEDLDFGNARTPEAVERLAARAESLVVLHEADLLWPRCDGT